MQHHAYNALQHNAVEERWPHIIGLDYLRLISAFAVVWIHGSDTNSTAKSLQLFSSFAVPSFIMMSLYLSTMSLERTPGLHPVTFLYRRVKRLIPAYLAWSMIYVILRFIKHGLIVPSPFVIDWTSIVFAGGASYQLWYVPALIFWLIIFVPLIILTAQTNRTTIQGTVFILSALILYWFGKKINSTISVSAEYLIVKYMIAHTCFVLSGIGLWGLVRPLKDINQSWQMKNHGLIGILGSVVILVANRIGILQDWFTLFFSLSVFLIALQLGDHHKSIVTKYLSPCAFGIYLCHGIFVEGFQTIAKIMQIDIGSFYRTTGIIVTSFLCSLALCFILRLSRKTKWLVA